MTADFRNGPALQGILQHLEDERKILTAARRKAISCFVFGVFLTIAVSFFSLLPIWFYIPGIAVLLYTLNLYLKIAPAYLDYRVNFKSRLLKAILKSNYQDITFEPDDGLPEDEFMACQLFTEAPDKYSSKNSVTGSLAKTRFYFSEVNASYKTESTDVKGNRAEKWHEIFKGIIFTADFNKNFNGITLISPENIGSKLVGWFTKALPISNLSGSKLVVLEDPEFNKTFTTHSTDQIEARHILTPAMMNRILFLNKKTKSAVMLSFIASRLYIAFPLESNYFEPPPLSKSILGPSSIDQGLYIVQFMYDIINELDLNTKIRDKN
ncbi:hypothetical protein HDE68_001515 [Pedobacter cryoconitis]|uniref:Galanin n=1 Tax=Pedobacter cryoconitis TaxID=188932 RepID=A0A7W8ZKM5_9SPHI|nr:DUF3137 domain-containing protein [Pedobacter cryoconitis]MBB5635627.1 hypothetical protein [Pedobacter cryoconitis]